MNSTEDRQPTTASLRTFSLGLGAILLTLGGLQYFWRHHGMAGSILAGAGVLAGVMGLIFPAAMRGVYKLFLIIGEWLGWINTRILLFLIYFLIFTPAGMVMRLFGRDIMNLKFDRRAKSYWIAKAEDERGTERYEKMY